LPVRRRGIHTLLLQRSVRTRLWSVAFDYAPHGRCLDRRTGRTRRPRARNRRCGRAGRGCAHRAWPFGRPSHPPELERGDVTTVLQRLFCVAALWGLRRWERMFGEEATLDELEPMTRAIVENARGISGADVFDLLERAQLIGRATAEWHDHDFDVLLMAATPDVAPPLGVLQASDDDDVSRATKAMMPVVSLLAWRNVTGQPSISLPLAMSDDGLPIGIQLVAAQGGEGRLLTLASQLERALPWNGRHPAL
jgi:amidase